jgi:hypothetical protein
VQLKQSHQDMRTEMDMVRAQARGQRPEGMSMFPAGASHASYSGPVVQPYLPPLVQPSHQLSPSQMQSSAVAPSSHSLKSSTHMANGSGKE